MASVVIVDSACCLPERVVNSKSVEVLPLTVLMDGREVSDTFTAEDRAEMVRNGSLDIKHDIDTRPATRDEIVDFMAKRILPNYDFAIVQTVARDRSPQYEMWQEVNTTFAAEYRKYRTTDRNFTLRIMDSGGLFTGQGLMALNTIYLGQQEVSRRELLEKSKAMYDHIQSYSAPVDLHYLRERARRKGDRSVGLFAAHLGKALNISPIIRGGQNRTENMGKVKGHENAVDKMIDHAMRCMEAGLQTPIICIAYSGPLDDLKKFKRLDELREMAKEYGVKVATSVATMAALINMGPGTFTMAVAPKDPTMRLRLD